MIGLVTNLTNTDILYRGVDEYSGIDPIVVDNEQQIISANHVGFGIQDPLYYVQNDNSGCVIGVSGVLTDSAAFYPMTGNPSGFISSETDWTNTIKAASSNAYNQATAQDYRPTYHYIEV